MSNTYVLTGISQNTLAATHRQKVPSKGNNLHMKIPILDQTRVNSTEKLKKPVNTVSSSNKLNQTGILL